MKTMPLTAISSFSAMVERVRPAVLDQTRSRSCHNRHRIARATCDAPRRVRPPRDVTYLPSDQARPFRFRAASGKSVPHHEWRICLIHVPRRWQWRRRRSPRAYGDPPGRASSEKTLRADRWWLYPLTTFVVFMSFIVYATIRAFQGSHYYAAPYLSPFYSPCLGDCVKGASDFGQPFAVVAAVGGADRADLPAGLPADLLLLPQGLLPVVLAEPAGVRRRRAAHRPTAARPGCR